MKTKVWNVVFTYPDGEVEYLTNTPAEILKEVIRLQGIHGFRFAWGIVSKN